MHFISLIFWKKLRAEVAQYGRALVLWAKGRGFDSLLQHFCFFFFELITELNKLDAETKNKTLLKAIEYYYYSKKLSNSKDGKKKDNKGFKLIKTFIKNMYI